jgi:hypothetical protein
MSYPKNPITTHSNSLQLMLTHCSCVLFLLLCSHPSFTFPFIVLPYFSHLSYFACRIVVFIFRPLYLLFSLDFFSCLFLLLYSLPSMFLQCISILNAPFICTPLLPSYVVTLLLHIEDFPQNCIQKFMSNRPPTVTYILV